MPRPKKEARLRLRKDGARRIWVIKDGSRYIRTGCSEADLEGAEGRLREYLAEKYEPPTSGDPSSITSADVLIYYLRHRIPQLADPIKEGDFITQLEPFWSDKTMLEVSAKTSREYAAQRQATGVKPSTARRELETLRAAVNYFMKEHNLPYRPVVEMPPKSSPRDRWLTRKEVARFITAARRRGNHHVARLILIGLYTGTRSGAIKKMRWVPSIDGGWFDLDNGVMYRRGSRENETTKRRPSVRIPDRLIPHLKRWKKADGLCTYAIHRDGVPLDSVKKAWRNSREDADLDADVIPHSLRHTCATWGMQNGADIYELAGFLGMSVKMLNDVYGHHHPNHQKRAADAVSMRPGAQIG